MDEVAADEGHLLQDVALEAGDAGGVEDHGEQGDAAERAGLDAAVEQKVGQYGLAPAMVEIRGVGRGGALHSGHVLKAPSCHVRLEVVPVLVSRKRDLVSLSALRHMAGLRLCDSCLHVIVALRSHGGLLCPCSLDQGHSPRPARLAAEWGSPAQASKWRRPRDGNSLGGTEGGDLSWLELTSVRRGSCRWGTGPGS